MPERVMKERVLLAQTEKPNEKKHIVFNFELVS